PPRTRRRRVGQRTGRALRDQAAGGDEASRCARRCRPDQAVEGRTDRDGGAAARADARGDGLAAPLRALLVEEPRSAHGLCRSQEEEAMTSLTLVRRIKARPLIVFDALTTPEGIAIWWGPDDGPVLVAETDPRVGGHFRVRFRRLDGSEHESSGEYLEFVKPE